MCCRHVRCFILVINIFIYVYIYIYIYTDALCSESMLLLLLFAFVGCHLFLIKKAADLCGGGLSLLDHHATDQKMDAKERPV